MKQSGWLSWRAARRFGVLAAPATLAVTIWGCSVDGQGEGPGVRTQRQLQTTQESLAFDFELDGRPYQLSLARSSAPAPEQRTVLRLSADGRIRETTVTNPECFYSGVVLDLATGAIIPGSYASVSTCIHTAGHPAGTVVHGVVSLGQELLTISPVEGDGEGTQEGTPHLTYEAESVRLGGAEQSARVVRLLPVRPTLAPPAEIWEGTDKETKLVELLLINGAERTRELGEQVGADGLSLVHNMNAVLAGSGVSPRVRVVVTGQIDFEEDPFEWPAFGAGEVDAPESLGRLTDWATGADVPDHDARMMLTYKDLENSTVGIAYVGAMCGPTASLLVQTTENLSMISATIATHELGHSLGMGHDGQENGCPGSGFIMAASAGPGSASDPQFSSCSVDEFSSFLGDGVGPTCLDNAPIDLDVSTCGDAAVGPGEECDCGQEDCSELDPCCDGSTCQLAAGAECSNFNDPTACCFDCKMATAEDEVVCRPARDECDLPEVCTGRSFECPGDFFEESGGECSDSAGNAGTCFAGTCMSRARQCQEIGARFGQPFGDPADACRGMAGCGQVTCSLGGNCYSLQGETVVDGIGCGEGDVCSDGECVGLESADLCPTDPEKEEPGVCGCGATDEDSDADQTPDCQDECPQDEAKTEAGECGCGAAEPNGLGITVCGDSCPEDVDKIEPGVCGCGTADTDTDADLVADCNDGCPQNPNKVAPDANGCEDAPALGAGGALSGVGGSLVGVGGMSGVGGSPAGGLPGAGGTLSAGAAGPGGAMAAESGGGCSLATRPATGSRSGAMALAMLVSLGWSSRRRRRLQPFASR